MKVMVLSSSSSSSSSSSTSSSSQSSGGRPDQIQGMGEFQRLHLHSSPPPPPHPHRKAMKKHGHYHHHGSHSPNHPHHYRHFGHKHRHYSAPPPLCALHCKKDKLCVKPSKHCKKVGKLNRKLIKVWKVPKGAHRQMHNVCPGSRVLSFPFSPTDAHHPGCCLHYRGLGMVQDEMLQAELQQRPHCEGGIGRDGRRTHPHCHGRHGPAMRSEIRRGSAHPMPPSHEAKAMPAECPAIEVGVPPPASGNMLLADKDGPAEI